MNGLSDELLNQMPGGYFYFTEEGILLGINQTLLDQLGYDAPDMAGKPVEALLTIASRIFYQTHFYPLLKLQGKADEIFLSLRMKNGQALPVLLNAASLKRDDSRVYQCVCLPVRQRQKYEEEILQSKREAQQALRENKELLEAKQTLEQHQHLLDQQLTELAQKNQQLWQFSKLITHDLQEPLRKITLLADALRQEEGQGLVLDEGKLLDRIMAASQSMRALIRRLGDYLSLEVDPEQIGLIDLQQVVVNASERVSQQHVTNIRLVTHDLPQIEGDRGQLVNLFIELMTNSVLISHQPAHPPLEITITGQLIEQNSFRSLPGKYRYEEFIRITYSDNGPGLKIGLGDQLFLIHKNTSAGLLKLGFGLAICKKIIDNHGGMISVTPNSGSGAEFVILLPVRHHNLITN
ncbi:PAS domain S-box protein [Spirosoma sp. KCTC 42546]|uniref:ATP-binding protein n=1 Tax=Spirosoma sp. KCTC 42546 TaxID=2520506 RepID=UPI00115B69FA|nr:ATP-binding protein [Spirosoma sp. KCTC 42546]QDK77525.1 PAS domain S-box protein [Spirosoma sp. KCTC 42546]